MQEKNKMTKKKTHALDAGLWLNNDLEFHRTRLTLIDSYCTFEHKNYNQLKHLIQPNQTIGNCLANFTSLRV